MEKKFDKSAVIETNINVLMAMIEDPQTTAKVRVQASEALLQWMEKRTGLDWEIDL